MTDYDIVSSAFAYKIQPEVREMQISEGVKARICDPYWYLARQYQLGEFRGSNGGSPMNIFISSETMQLTKTAEKKTKENIPLQALIESNDSGLDTSLENKIILENDLTEKCLSASNAWQKERLEYRVHVEATNGGNAVELSTNEYQGRNLDWYDMRYKNKIVSKDPPWSSPPVLPTQVSFIGMPKSRFWELEDNRVDLGSCNRPGNFLSLLLMDFGMIYSNDWFIIPLQQQVNTLRRVCGVTLQDVFNTPINVQPNKTEETALNVDEFQHFALKKDDGQYSTSSAYLLLMDSIINCQASEPIEKAVFFRDENANLVWAIEQKTNREPVELPTAENDSKSAPVQSTTEYIRTYSPLRLPVKNYIPYKPVKRREDNQVLLRRGRTTLDPTTPQYQSKLLEEAKWLCEEEVPSIPISVSQHARLVSLSSQMKEKVNGERSIDLFKYYLWVGRQKGSSTRLPDSNLKFDTTE